MGSVSVEAQVKEKKRKEKKAHYFDYSLLAIVIFLMCFGLVMLYSTSSYSAALKFGNSMYYFKKQAQEHYNDTVDTCRYRQWHKSV